MEAAILKMSSHAHFSNLLRSVSYIWVFPKCFHWIRWIQWQNICHYSKRAQTCHCLCKRPGCSHRTSKTHVRDRIFKLNPIQASVIYQIPWIRWIHWISDPFRENSIEISHLFFVFVHGCTMTYAYYIYYNTAWTLGSSTYSIKLFAV